VGQVERSIGDHELSPSCFKHDNGAHVATGNSDVALAEGEKIFALLVREETLRLLMA
jgi:hypothetical protein